MRVVASLLVVVGLVVTGCSSSGEEPVGLESMAPVETHTAKVDPSWSPEPEDPSADPTHRRRAMPDPDLVASLDCEVIPDAFFEADPGKFGVPTKAIHVSAGPGLDPAVDWSIAMFDMPGDDGYGPRVDAYLTDAFSIHDGKLTKESTWIRVAAGDPWHYLEWDDEALVRAESALAKATSCLEAVEG